jgi:Tol biopolymer transport system component
VLLTRANFGSSVTGLAPGDTRERDLSFLDFGFAKDLSSDGRTFVYDHWGIAAGRNYTEYLGKTDGSPAIKLGDGGNGHLSPDGKWVLAITVEPPRIVLLPTGAGVTTQLEKYGIEQYNSVSWFPDGKRILFVGREPGHLDRCYVQPIDSGGPKAIAPEGVFCWGVLPDGKSMLAFNGENTAIYPTDGEGTPRPIPGLEQKDRIAGWNSDGKSLYVYPVGGSSTKISRLDVATGRQEVLREMTLSDPAGVLETPTIILTPDGKGYIYTTRRTLTDLYLADGLR